MLPVDLPWPRTAALRETPEFDALVAQVSHALRERSAEMKRRLIVAANALAVFAALLVLWQLDSVDLSRAAVHAALAVGRGESSRRALSVVAAFVRDHRGGSGRRTAAQHRRWRGDRADLRAVALGAPDALSVDAAAADRARSWPLRR